jgi:hypothetical protein
MPDWNTAKKRVILMILVGGAQQVREFHAKVREFHAKVREFHA